MNVFEDLIVELQEENLLENTEKDNGRHARVKKKSPTREIIAEPPASPAEPESETQSESKVEFETAGETFSVEAADEPKAEQPTPKPSNGNEFYKKRAVGELSNLQMVEHVLTGVEREYMKIVPNVFDDFAAKKALNNFLQVAENENSEQHAEAEFALMTETESWCSALGKRDSNVSVSNLRLYCENSRPPLSSQALVALARFYRNLPYTELVRAKFDFMMTRLFSRPSEQGMRVSLFERDEILNHINTLYKDWSSIALYSAGDDESDSLLAALSFEDLAIEAENTSTFDALIESGFFGRLRIFKESISELFYAPHVTAAAIECNVRVGNAYVNLLERARQKMDAESIQTKYGHANDQSASDAAGHTLDLVGILSEIPPPAAPAEEAVANENVQTAEQERTDANALTSSRPPVSEPVAKAIKAAKARSPFFGNLVENALSVNRWFLGLSVALIAASFGIYLWSNFAIANDATTAGVQTVQIENVIAQEHVNTARISGETFYALMQPSWDLLPKEKRVEILKAIYQVATEKGCKQVHLTNRQGKAAGYATPTRTEIIMP